MMIISLPYVKKSYNAEFRACIKNIQNILKYQNLSPLLHPADGTTLVLLQIIHPEPVLKCFHSFIDLFSIIINFYK